MSASKKFAVGIFILTEMNNKPCVALSQRGHYKIEADKNGVKQFTPESFIGISQATSHGGQTKSEIADQINGIELTLLRELGEETNLNPHAIWRIARLIHVHECHVKKIFFYAAYLPIEIIMRLRFEPCKNLNLLYLDDIDSIRTDIKRSGFFEKGTAMFPSDKKALKKIFEHFTEIKQLYCRRKL